MSAVALANDFRHFAARLPKAPEAMARVPWSLLSLIGNMAMPDSVHSKQDSLRHWLAQGCDERVLPDSRTNNIKYHLDPCESQGLHYRGSCTSGVLTTDTREVAERALSRISQGDFEGWAEEQRSRLKQLVPTEQPFDVWFAPSGTDLLYFPLLLARSFTHRPLLNLLSCPEELGSGSRLAVAGKFFSQRTANGKVAVPGDVVHSDLVGEVIELPARSKDGLIRNRKEDIDRLLEEHADRHVIVHLVFGSKSGIKDDLDIITQRPNVSWTVDLCQFRADPELIGHLLQQGAMVLITGSKFYHAPPFCGALLTPSDLGDELEGTTSSAASSLAPILAQSDVPQRLQKIRSALTMRENPGSRLRWACALHELEAIHAHSRTAVDAAIRSWNHEVVGLIHQHPEFKLIPDQSKTNESIISFGVQVEGEFLEMGELKEAHRILCTADWSHLGRFSRVFIGQPVNYGEQSFIRVALGSRDVRRRIEGEVSRESDTLMLNLLAQICRDLRAS